MSPNRREGLTTDQRMWLVRATAYRDLAPTHEAELRAEADAIPDAVGPVRRGGLTTRQVEQLHANWQARQATRRPLRFERRR